MVKKFNAIFKGGGVTFCDVFNKRQCERGA